MNFWAPGDLPTEAGSDVRWFWSMTVLVDWRLGSRAPSAKVLMRIGLVVTSGSPQIFASARPLTDRAEPTDQPAQPAQPT
jgi:hypothetical protein